MKLKWLYGVLFLVGCGSEVPLSPQEFCEGMQKSHCARLYQCATSPVLQAALKILYASEADCVVQGIALQKPVCSQWTEENICGLLGSSAWNSAAAKTCVKDLGAQSCTRVFDGVLPGSCMPDDYCF